ncbi:MAG: ABC transporter ATP-binding protein [candidate division NC10 bacterium]|nr:ABC transporter ATP-binding protein [candidate division NC10 bacterium]
MALLEGTGVTKYFGGLAALLNVDFYVEEGEIVSLIGPNGSGKTTLFNLIGGHLNPTRGSIRFLGKDISGLRPYQICQRGIGRAFQIVSPFLNLTVLDNVTVGSLFGKGRWSAQGGKAATQDACQILELVGLAEKKKALARNLSIGELKRLEVAMALSTKPRLLLLDEVLAGLSPKGAMEIMATIKEIRDKGVTVFVIEHVLKAVTGISDRVMVLDQGRKIAEGRPEEIITDRKVIEAYLGES